MYKLTPIYKHSVEEIIVIGHSVEGIDLPYFKRIDEHTKRKAIWKVYYFDKAKLEPMQQALEEQGVSPKRIRMLDAVEFYDLKS